MVAFSAHGLCCYYCALVIETMLSHSELQGIPLLVLANKMDLEVRHLVSMNMTLCGMSLLLMLMITLNMLR